MPLLAYTAAALTASCGSDAAVAPREPLPPLTDQRWYVQSADGQALPALIAHRLVDGSLEQVFLDSATVEIDADGSWLRRFWMQRFLGGAWVAAEASQIVGTWTANPETYDFVTEFGGRRFSLRDAPSEGATLRLPGIGANDAVVVSITESALPRGPFGAWTAAEVNGASLPSAIYVFEDYVEGSDTMSIHLIADSASIVMYPNGTYRHRIYLKEWGGAPGGPAEWVRYVWQTDDFGEWTRSDAGLAFESGWLQGLRFNAAHPAAGSFAIQHGISHGDERVPWRYVAR